MILVMDIKKTVKLHPGRYVVAVSGGVDSMALLHMLKDEPALRLTVAHFDHGIRPDSKQDRLLIQDVSRRHGLPFVYAEGNLGRRASEDLARQKRYEFLRSVKDRVGAGSIITAHHHDDALETAVHNIMRGTGRKGMSSLHGTADVVRPLLHVPKEKLLSYASVNELEWREDSTNMNFEYRRNYIRGVLLKRMREESPESFHRLSVTVKRMADLNRAIDGIIINFLHSQEGADQLKRHEFIMLPHDVAREVLAQWLRHHGVRQFGRKTLERLSIGLKTARPGKQIALNDRQKLIVEKHTIHLQTV
jgi:tRNA(Ile)-lysidine synthetase-like protein